MDAAKLFDERSKIGRLRRACYDLVPWDWIVDETRELVDWGSASAV